MLKERLKFIAAAAVGAAAVVLATGTGAHLVALHTPGSTYRADQTQVVSSTPETSPTPEASQSPAAAAPVMPAAATSEDEAAETVEDAQDVNEAAEPADATDATETTGEDVNDDKTGAAAVAQPVTLTANEHGAADHGSDGKGD
jgi:hypothetical protein